MSPSKKLRLARMFMLDILFDPSARTFLIYIFINILLGATIYHWLEGWSWLDSFYFVVITLTTIGYGDFTPTTSASKLITIFYSINGVIMLLFLFDLVRKVRGWVYEPSKPGEKDSQQL